MLFTGDMDPVKLRLFVGLALDRQVGVPHLRLEEYKDILMPVDEYASHDPFPPEWDQMVEDLLLEQDDDRHDFFEEGTVSATYGGSVDPLQEAMRRRHEEELTRKKAEEDEKQ